MKEIFCHTCGTLVAMLVEGSKIRKDSKHFCKNCHAKKNDMPKFFSDIFGSVRKS